MQFTIITALLTVNCLAIILEEVEDWYPLGELLQIDKEVLNAIKISCSGKEKMSSFINTMLSRWFREDPEQPIKLLIAGLRSLGKDDIATKVSHLFSFGMSSRA